jgi:FHA domain
VQLLLHGRRGLTVGKAAFGLRSVNVARFDAPGFWQVVLRVLVLWAGQVVLPIIGPALLFTSSEWDPEQRGRSWLDRVGRTYAIDIRRGLNPLDAKALRHARRALAAPSRAEVVELPSLATDRPLDEHTFIPAARSSSGVVSAAVVSGWEPPPLGAPAIERPSSGPAVPDSAIVPAARPATPPAGAERPASTAIPGRSAWVLAFDDGTKVVAPDRGFVGRAPAPPGGEPAVLVPLVDTSMRISKTHAEIGVDASGFWISDRGSRNGTAVEMPDGAVRTLGRGETARLPAGSRVTLGGRWFTVSDESRGIR